jgi:putative PEP-CTERM system histidine kinase
MSGWSIADPATAAALTSGLVYSVFALRFVDAELREPNAGRSSAYFGAALITSALWGWVAAAQSYFEVVPGALVALLDLARYASWFGFLIHLLAPAAPRSSSGAVGLLGQIAVLSVLVGLAFLVAEVAGITSATTWRLVVLSGLAMPVAGLTLVEQVYRGAGDDWRWSAKPLCLGLGLIFAFDLYLYSQALLLGAIDEAALAVRGVVLSLAAALLHMSWRRRGNWTARLQVSRTAVFHSAALILAGTYLLIVAGIGYYIRYFGGAWGEAVQLVASIFAITVLVAITVSGTMRSRLRVSVRKHFFHYRYDYREEWLRLTATLSAPQTSNEPTAIGDLVIRGLADMVESPGGALWTRAPGLEAFVQTAQVNAPRFEAHEFSDSSLCQFLLRKGWIIDVAQCTSEPERYDGLVLPKWLVRQKSYWLIIPLFVTDELIGFVALSQPRAPLELNWEVTDLLKTAGRQAAGFLAQVQATEALIEARKFDAFNRMSAFVVHDLKNIVTQLSLMLTNAKRLHANPEFQQDMLATVEGALEKMRQMMLQLREGEASPSGQSGVDLAQVLRRAEGVATQRGRQIELRIVHPARARGHEQRIERVLGHVMQNALDATGPVDRVWIELRRHGGQARIEIGDTGTGMTQEYIRTRLFKPFQSTKQLGMGIGAYESLQYVRELGGNIEVDSDVGRGTIMTIALPLFEWRGPTELEEQGAK